MMEYRICKKCGVEKQLSASNFYKNRNIFDTSCKKCKNLQSREYQKNNKKNIYEQRKEYRELNSDEISKKLKIYYDENKAELRSSQNSYYQNNKEDIMNHKKEYRKDNIDLVRKQARIYINKRIKEDVAYSLKLSISTIIRKVLKNKSVLKGGKSVKKYLPYSFQELQEHLESQFEPWMNWDNWKKYNPKTWDDNNSSTWTWNVDHIIPQSDLPYTSMEDDNFKMCWSLNNLRPLNDKQNILDGTSKIRHMGHK